MKIRTNRTSGFTLVEVMIVVAIVGVLAGLSTPNLIKARDNAQINSIISNLRQIESVKEQWALENRQGNGAVPVEADLLPFFRGNHMPTPYVNETYSINPIGTPATAVTQIRLGSYAPGDTISLP